MKKGFEDLVERIERIENRLGEHEARENDLLIDLIKAERKCKRSYSKVITINEALSIIPFEIFDLNINGTFVARGITKTGLIKDYINSLYGYYRKHEALNRIIDVRISLRESLVDLITETR